MREIEAADFDEQLKRAFSPPRYSATQPDVAQAVATRAAMLERQGIDPGLAYSADIVRQIELQQIARRSDELAERFIAGIFLAVLLGIWFGWLA